MMTVSGGDPGEESKKLARPMKATKALSIRALTARKEPIKHIFPTEEELVRVIMRSGQHPAKGITHRKLNVLAEFETSVGCADVIFFFLKKGWRKHMAYGRLPARWVYALKMLPLRKRFTIDEFMLRMCARVS